jgi:hypothetical protein
MKFIFPEMATIIENPVAEDFGDDDIEIIVKSR